MKRVAPVTVLRGHAAEVQALDFVENGSTLLSGDSNGTVRCWNLATARSTPSFAHSVEAGVLCVRALPGEQRVVTQGRDGAVKLWQLLSDGRLAAGEVLLHTESFHFCRLAVPGHGSCGSAGRGLVAVASTGNKGVDIWDTGERRRVVAIAGEDDTGMTMSLTFPPATAPLIVAGKESGHLACWDLRHPAKALCQLRVDDKPCLTVATVPRRPQGAGAGDSACVRERDALREGSVSVLSGGASATLTWSILCSSEGAFKVHGRHTLAAPGIAEVAVREDARICATAGWDCQVRVFHTRSRSLLAVLKQHRSAVAAAAFASRVGTLASGGRDGVIALWDIYQPCTQEPNLATQPA